MGQDGVSVVPPASLNGVTTGRILEKSSDPGAPPRGTLRTHRARRAGEILGDPLKVVRQLSTTVAFPPHSTETSPTLALGTGSGGLVMWGMWGWRRVKLRGSRVTEALPELGAGPAPGDARCC